MRRTKAIRDAALCAFLALLAVWLGFRVYDLAGKADVAYQAAREAKVEAASLAQREADLNAHIADLKSPRGQDAAIRTAFDVAKPGEQIIVVVPPKTVAATSTPSWWERFLEWF